jgi:hypothetical protein
VESTSTPTANASGPQEAIPPKKKEMAAKANATKSVLSMNSGFQSSAALALGALSKGNASRRSKGSGMNDLASVVAERDDEEKEKNEKEERQDNISPLHKHSTGKRAEPAPESKPSENEPKAITPKPEKRQPGQTKSVLSQSTSMQSSSAMALGSLLNKGTASRRGNSAEKGDLQSVVASAAKGSTDIAQQHRQPESASNVGTSRAQQQREPESASNAGTSIAQQQREPESASNAGTSSAVESKVGGPTTSKPRRKGPDAKSVISGMGNSSSAASSLLGPMLQGQPKRRQRGGDHASIIE